MCEFFVFHLFCQMQQVDRLIGHLVERKTLPAQIDLYVLKCKLKIKKGIYFYYYK